MTRRATNAPRRVAASTSDSARVFLYLLDHDTGYAPNPFHGWCTLAGCKPQVRKSAEVGDWIIGVTPKHDGNRVAYVMCVEHKFPIRDYWSDRRFRMKQRRPQPSTPISKCADNHRTPRDRDPDNAYVLASRTFSYYGSRPRDWPRSLREMQMPGRYYLVNHAPELLRELLRFVRACRPGVHAPPRAWAEDDVTWRTASRRRSCV